MATLIRRGEQQQQQQQAALVRNPWQMIEELDRLFPDPWQMWPRFGQIAQQVAGDIPLADVEESDDAYTVRVEMPGVNKDDIEVDVSGRTLRMKGERKEQERKGILRRSTRTSGIYEFETVMPGDIDADKVEARQEDGVLVVTLPKPDSSRNTTRKIDVS